MNNNWNNYIKQILKSDLNKDLNNEQILLKYDDLKKMEQKIKTLFTKSTDDKNKYILKVKKILMNMLAYYSHLNNEMFEKNDFSWKNDNKVFEDIFRAKNKETYKKILENNKKNIMLKNMPIYSLDFRTLKINESINENISFLCSVYNFMFDFRNSFLKFDIDNEINNDELCFVKTLFYLLLSSNIFIGNFYSMIISNLKNVFQSDDEIFQLFSNLKKIANNYISEINKNLNTKKSEKYKNKDEKKINEKIREIFNIDDKHINLNEYTYFIFKILNHNLSLSNFFYELPILAIENNKITWNSNLYKISDEVNASSEVNEIFKRLEFIRSGIIHNPIYIKDKEFREFKNNSFLEVYSFIYKTLFDFSKYLENIKMKNWFTPIIESNNYEDYILLGKKNYFLKKEERNYKVTNLTNGDSEKVKGLHRSTIILLVKREIKNLSKMLTTLKFSINKDILVQKDKTKNFYANYGERNKILNINKSIENILKYENKLSSNSINSLSNLKNEVSRFSKNNLYKKEKEIIENKEIKTFFDKNLFKYELKKFKYLKYSSGAKIHPKNIEKDELNKLKKIIFDDELGRKEKTKLIIKLLNIGSKEEENFKIFLEKYMDQKDFVEKNFSNFYLKNRKIILETNLENNENLRYILESDNFKKDFKKIYIRLKVMGQEKNGNENVIEEIASKLKIKLIKNKDDSSTSSFNDVEMDIKTFTKKEGEVLRFWFDLIDDDNDEFENIYLKFKEKLERVKKEEKVKKKLSENILFFFRERKAKIEIDLSKIKTFIRFFNLLETVNNPKSRIFFDEFKRIPCFDDYIQFNPEKKKWLFKKNNNKIFLDFMDKIIIYFNKSSLYKLTKKDETFNIKINSKIEKVKIPENVENKLEEFRRISKENDRLIIFNRLVNVTDEKFYYNKEWLKRNKLQINTTSDLILKKDISTDNNVNIKIIGINEELVSKIKSGKIKEVINYIETNRIISNAKSEYVNELSKISSYYEFKKQKFMIKEEVESIKNIKNSLKNIIENHSY